MECKGKGECFEQTIDGYKKHHCDKRCVLHECSICLKELPEWVMACHGGTCLDCKLSTIPLFCEYCRGRLVPIGHARKNGKDRPDWLYRKYHKKCYKLMKR